MADEELGVLLVPEDKELEESLQDREVKVGVASPDGEGGAGGTGNAAAGGFAGAEAGELLGRGGLIVGLLAGILSQLKPVTQFLKLIFRVLSLALLPAIQLLVVALRPLLTSLAKSTVAAENPGRTFDRAGQALERDVRAQPGRAAGIAAGFLTPNLQPQTGAQIGETLGGGIEAIESILNGQKNTSDHSDEERKNQQANFINEILDLVP